MIGHIESFDLDRQTGVIKSGGSFYEFHLDAWTSPETPEAGDDVKFELEDDTVKVVALVGAYLDPNKPVKSRWTAAILALFLGGIGAHRFYLGYYGIGLAQLALTVLTVGYGVVWGFIEFALLVTKNFNLDAKGRPLK
ncbi:MAG: TM2 domain-containing protein [Gammaproteobacteria bacterium]